MASGSRSRRATTSRRRFPSTTSAGTSSLRRLTFGGNNRLPIWSADGKRVAFQSDRDGDRAIFWQPVDGGTAERLTRPEPGTSHVPESWAPREDVFLFSVTKGFGINPLDLFGSRSEGVAFQRRGIGGVSDRRGLFSGRTLGRVPGG